MSFAIGDKIICTDKGENRFITVGQTYEVLGLTRLDERVSVTIVADDGEAHSYYTYRFTTKAPKAPTARVNDPATSKGKRKVNKYEEAVLNALDLGEGNKATLTGKEIAQLTGHPLNCITPRFAPLRRKGLIKDSGIKRDKQIVWVLV